MWGLRRRRKRLRRAHSARAQAQYRQHVSHARAVAHARVAQWGSIVGAVPGRIAIRNQRTRWGSCSSKGNLNFNYRIVFLPIELVDYIVVHELCHLLEFNHSSVFWGHVGRVLPNYPLHRAALRSIAPYAVHGEYHSL